MTSREPSSFNAILGLAFVVGSVLAPPAQAQATQGTQPTTAAPGRESETERLAKRLNAEIDRRDAHMSPKRSLAEQEKYDRELAVENEILRKAGRDAAANYKARELAAAERRRAQALSQNPK